MTRVEAIIVLNSLVQTSRARRPNSGGMVQAVLNDIAHMSDIARGVKTAERRPISDLFVKPEAEFKKFFREALNDESVMTRQDRYEKIKGALDFTANEYNVNPEVASYRFRWLDEVATEFGLDIKRVWSPQPPKKPEKPDIPPPEK